MGDNKNEEFNKFRKATEIIEYIKKKQFGHVMYCHYTTIENIDKILSNSVLLLNKISVMNDKNEDKGNNNTFALCFAGTYSENIPLWYLYSGIDGKGGRLSFRNKVFNNWLFLGDNKDTIKICPRLYKKNNNNYVECNDFNINKDDYEICARDILYTSKENKKGFRVKYNSYVINGLDKNEYKKLEEQYSLFNKNLSWFYEKEFRILLIVKNNKLKELLNLKDSSEENIYKLGFNIEKEIPNLDVVLAPEIKDNEVNEILMKEGIKKYLNGKLLRSELTGQIEMNLNKKLCDKCKKYCQKDFEKV